MILRSIFLTVILLINSIAFAQEFQKEVGDLTGMPEMKGAGLGICIYDIGNDSVFYELNSGQLLVPASVLKIVTSAAALEILGSDYTFHTTLSIAGKINERTGFLKGNLIIKGGGDPALGSEYFKDRYLNPHFLDSWLNKIIMAGIRGIDGNIIIDESIYDDKAVPDTWVWEDMGNYYGAGVSALTVYDNMFRITFSSPEEAGYPAEIVEVDQWADWLKIENTVVSSDNNSDYAYVFGDPWGGIRKISGSIPKGKEEFKIKASLPEPGLVLGNLLKDKLESKNIPIKGKVKKAVPVNPGEVISDIESPKLSEIIEVLNHESVNLFAEHLIKHIAFEKNGLGSTKEGTKIIKDFWAEKGIDTQNLFMEDGSGLSRFNGIAPKQLTGVLKYMSEESTNSKVFMQSLPVPGEGTLYYFSSDRFRKGSLSCKSGSMTRVRSYAGYLKTKKGNDLAFTVMVNNFSLSHTELIKKIEQLLVTLINSE